MSDNSTELPMYRFIRRFGDGFSPNIREDVKDVALEIQGQPLETYSNHNQMAMAVRPRIIDVDNWLAVDFSYAAFAKARKMLLNCHREEVVAYRQHPGAHDQEVDQACREVLNMVVEHLTSTYPQYFKLDGNSFTNDLTGEEFNLANPFCKPLELAARIAIEDFNILLPIEVETDNGKEVKYQLAATATLFPAAWIIKERVGSLVVDLHKPVPGWSAKLATAVENRLKKIGFGVDGRGEPSDKQEMERLAVFPQIDRPALCLGDLLFVQTGDQFYPPGIDPTPETMIFRRERQTFRRIQGVNGVLFSVRTSLQFLDQIDKEELVALIEHTKMLLPDHAAYKERHRWLPCLEEHAMEKFGVAC